MGPPGHRGNRVENGQRKRRDRPARAAAHHLSDEAREGIMTRIDFYSNADSKLQVACQLAAKAVREQSQVVVYAPDPDTARSFDRMLWTYQAIGFVPHCLASDALSSET